MQRIIFWIDWYLIPFGIAYFLQKKTDCQFFSIYDVNNRTKEFFTEQKIVNFKETWFYRDWVYEPKEKVDYKYLAEFENRTGIDLWKVVYSERRFYKYNPYYQFKRREILSIIEQDCKFFEMILNKTKPTHVIMNTTAQGRNYLFYQLCKANKINIMCLVPTRFGYRAAISSDIDVFDNKEEHEIKQKYTMEQLKEYFEKYNTFQQLKLRKVFDVKTSLWKKLYHGLYFVFIVCNSEYRRWYGNYGRTRWKILLHETALLLKKKMRIRFIRKNAVKNIQREKPFVYFPLHHQPERSTLISAPYFENLQEVMSNIAKSLPSGYQLLVKEHPGMRPFGWRPIQYYKNILSLPNVKLVSPDVKPDELFKNCSLTITVTGTSGIESAFYSKPTIVFADVSYSYLPFIYRVKKLEELPKIIKNALASNHDFSELSHYVDLVDNNSFEFDLTGIGEVIEHIFFKSGNIADSKISNDQMKMFLSNYDKELRTLADKFIQLIESAKG